ncbi:MAG: alpha/beta hydrolase fold domain-containing protein [Acidobacteria bacterium]|nr:alpha/beta hydrolase fold domain-containing protein [Acidobacteriota bacterium]
MLRGLLLLTLLLAPALPAQDSADWTAHLNNEYRITPDVVYSTANGYDAELDLYLPRQGDGPWPTLIYIHGGGWVGGSKEGSTLMLMPYLQMGMAVVNVEYRLARFSLAPAAVADCRCALRWIYANAKQYGFDTSKLVVTGNSAGGHLALTTGTMPKSAGFDYECTAGNPDTELKVAAVVNWYGITDVVDLLSGPNQKSYAVRWLGALPNREEVAKRASPIHYVRAGLPPILSIHGNADPTVPYQHAVDLHKALDKAKVKNKLITVPGGKHGGFNREQDENAFREIRAFLKETGVL